MSFLGLCLASTLEKKKSECQELKSLVDEKLAEIRDLRGKLYLSESDVKALGYEKRVLSDDVAQKDNIIIQYGKDVSELKKQLDEANGRASNLSDNFKILSGKYDKVLGNLKAFEANIAKAERVIRFMYESLSDEDKPEMASQLNKNFGIVFATPVSSVEPDSSNPVKPVSSSQEEPAEQETDLEQEDSGNNETGSEVIDDKGVEKEEAVAADPDERPKEECEHKEGKGCGKDDCCKKGKKNGNKKKKK